MKTRNALKVADDTWVLDVQLHGRSQRLVIYDAVRREKLLSIDIRGKSPSLCESLDQLMGLYGVPQCIKTDRSALFTGPDFRKWFRDRGIQHIVVVPRFAADWERMDFRETRLAPG